MVKVIPHKKTINMFDEIAEMFSIFSGLISWILYRLLVACAFPVLLVTFVHSYN